MSDWWRATQLSDAQYIPLVVLGTISSILSSIGSSSIIYVTYSDLSNKIMHRLLFALSTSDVIASLSFLLSPFLIPSYLDLPGASGSHQSCSAIGFFWLSAVGVTCFYNCYLSIYYLLVVQWSFRESDFKKYWEILAHSVAILIPVAINLVAIATKSINPIPLLNGICGYSVIPWGCIKEEECTKSSEATVESILIAAATVQFFLAVLSFACTFWVWRTVFMAIRRSNAHRFEGDRDKHSDERLKQVSTQAILYSLAYLNTIFWTVITVTISQTVPMGELGKRKERPEHYALALFFCTFYPLQGVMNFFIFARLKVQNWKKVEPERSTFWIYIQVLQSNKPPILQNRKTTNATIGNTTSIKNTNSRSPSDDNMDEIQDTED